MITVRELGNLVRRALRIDDGPQPSSPPSVIVIDDDTDDASDVPRSDEAPAAQPEQEPEPDADPPLTVADAANFVERWAYVTVGGIPATIAAVDSLYVHHALPEFDRQRSAAAVRHEALAAFGGTGNFASLSVDEVSRVVAAIERVYFFDIFNRTRRPVEVRLSTRLSTTAAHITTPPKGPFRLTVSPRVLLTSFSEAGQRCMRVNGVTVCDRIGALISVLEHELAHAIGRLDHDADFMAVVGHAFGHTAARHELLRPGNADERLTREEQKALKRGQPVGIYVEDAEGNAVKDMRYHVEQSVVHDENGNRRPSVVKIRSEDMWGRTLIVHRSALLRNPRSAL
jgi:hypothetical protein